jgi:hypothetical protein
MTEKWNLLVLAVIVLAALAGCASPAQPTNTVQPSPTVLPALTPIPTQAVATAAPSTIPIPAATATLEIAPTGSTTGPVTSDPTLARLVGDAQADLAQRADIAASSIRVISAEPVEWSDSSLGCPMEGQMYSQVITPGYLIVLEAEGREYEYHASTSRVVYCDK